MFTIIISFKVCPARAARHCPSVVLHLHSLDVFVPVCTLNLMFWYNLNVTDWGCSAGGVEAAGEEEPCKKKKLWRERNSIFSAVLEQERGQGQHCRAETEGNTEFF